MSQLLDWICSNPDTVIAIATAMAVVLSAIGLWFSAGQLGQASRSKDFETLTHLESLLRELETDYARTQQADKSDEAERVRTQIYNKLEMLSTAVRYKLIGKRSRAMAVDLLVDVVALDEHRGGIEHLGQQRQGSSFENLAWLTAKCRDRIDARKSEYRQSSPREEN